MTSRPSISSRTASARPNLAAKSCESISRFHLTRPIKLCGFALRARARVLVRAFGIGQRAQTRGVIVTRALLGVAQNAVSLDNLLDANFGLFAPVGIGIGMMNPHQMPIGRLDLLAAGDGRHLQNRVKIETIRVLMHR